MFVMVRVKPRAVRCWQPQRQPPLPALLPGLRAAVHVLVCVDVGARARVCARACVLCAEAELHPPNHDVWW